MTNEQYNNARRAFETVRDERATRANTATRIGEDFLLLLDLLATEAEQYLSKTSADTAQGVITFLRGLLLGNGTYGLDADGLARLRSAIFTEKVETAALEVTGWARFEKLVYNMLQVMEQDYQFSGGGDIEEVIDNHDGTYTLLIHKESEDRHTSFAEHDILYGKVDELAENGLYYTSWMRVCQDGVTLNDGMLPDAVRVELWGEQGVPGLRNFPPKAMMTVARRGNTTDAERQQFWELSTTDKCLTFYWRVDQPILRADNYALCLGILPTILDNAGVLPSTRDRKMPSLYVNTIFYENAHHIYYPSRVVKEDRGEWTATPTTTYTGMGGTYDGTTYVQGQTISEPYHHESFSRNIWLTHRLSPTNQSLSDEQLLAKMRNEWHVDLETSRVWRSGVLWESLVDGTTQAPSEGCTDWSPIQRPSTVYTIMPSMNAIHVVRTADGGYANPDGGSCVSLTVGYKRSMGDIIGSVADATEPFHGQRIYFRRRSRNAGLWSLWASYVDAEQRSNLVVNPNVANSGLNVNLVDMVEFAISSSDTATVTTPADIKDRMTVPIIADGAAGEPGAPGDPGSPGDPGEPGTPGADAEFYELEIDGGVSQVEFTANHAGVVTATPAAIILRLRHVAGSTQEYLSVLPSGMTLERQLSDGSWGQIPLSARQTAFDLDDGASDTVYRLKKNGTVISSVSLSAHWTHQRILLPAGVYANKRYDRTNTTTPLVLVDTGTHKGEYWFLDADTNWDGTRYVSPNDANQGVWAKADYFDVVLTKMLFAQFAQLGGFIVYDVFFFSRFGTLVASDGTETAIDNETAALTEVTGQKGGSSFTGVPYGWFDPNDPMPSGTHAPATTYRFRPAKCINAMTGEEWAAGGNVHFHANGNVSVNGTIRTDNLFRSVALCWGQDAAFPLATCLLEPSGAAKTYLYVKSLNCLESPALAAKYHFAIGDYIEYTSEMRSDPDDVAAFEDGMNSIDFADRDFVPCTYSADVVELVDKLDVDVRYPQQGKVYLPLPSKFNGKKVEVRHDRTFGIAQAIVTTVDPSQSYFMLYPSLDEHGDLKRTGNTVASQVTMNAGQTAFFYSMGSYWLYFPSNGGDRDPNERCKGMFLTAAKLHAAHPSPRVGDWAYVGTGFPAAIYVCETAGTWADSGSTYNGGNVNLAGYATKDYVHDRFRLLSEADYEQARRQGFIDENILYMTPEEEG